MKITTFELRDIPLTGKSAVALWLCACAVEGRPLCPIRTSHSALQWIMGEFNTYPSKHTHTLRTVTQHVKEHHEAR